MPIFDIQKDALCRLSETQLEELIARLAEAEVASNRFSPANVSRSGSIYAPDGGIDVRVDVPVDDFDTGFLARPNTIFQAKKQRMRASEIDKEMRPGGIRLPMLSEQARIRGSYIIVGLAEDCSEPEKRKRLDAMWASMDGDPNKDNIHLDFFDRSKLVQWLHQHPAVVLWVREVLGQPLSGWRSYGRWSNPLAGSDDTLILAHGVSIILPTGMGEKLTIGDAINPMRELVRSTNRTIRIIGLPGVGKTRIVQSLFEESVGKNALDRTIAIYADSGADHDPSAVEMLDRLIGENRRAIMVLDNCLSSLHATLASKVTSVDSKVTLITVEYDIRDDKPQSTEVVRIETDGPTLAEELLLQRYPEIGPDNAKKIAEFAGGNARVSLAVAERVKEGESLAHLSDAQLFDRLFKQRNQPNESLRVHAEALSLVYSFSVSPPKGVNHHKWFGEFFFHHFDRIFKSLQLLVECVLKFVGWPPANSERKGGAPELRRTQVENTTQFNDIDELAVLGSICNVSREQLFRSVTELLRRDIVQKRSDWRAILPHAIANRLAGRALGNLEKETLRKTFEAPGHERLLASFAHRLGLIHDHPVAREIVEEWLQPNSMLGELLSLDNFGAKILEYVVPTAPCAILDKLETKISAPVFKGLRSDEKPHRTIPNLLRSLAYDADKFDRCVDLLLRLAEFNGEINIDNLVTSLFQPYLSGTHASLDQRLKVVQETAHSKSKKRRNLGFQMLSAALDGPPWSSSYMNDFGARPRDFGFQPDHEELVEWRSRFIDLAVELDCSEDQDVADVARGALAQNFRGLWDCQPVRDKLIEAAKAFNDRQHWIDGWKEVRSTTSWYVRKKNEKDETKSGLDELKTLEIELAPKLLLDKIKAYVFWDEYDYRLLDLEAKAEELGHEFACSGQSFFLLGPDLFSTNGTPFLHAFGKGLAKVTINMEITWNRLVELLNGLSIKNFNVSSLRGFIEVVNENDHQLAQKLLDQCLDNSLLSKHLVELHPTKTFDHNDFNRCIKALNDPEVNGQKYGDLLWNDAYSNLSSQSLIELGDRLLKKNDGEMIILSALSIKLLGTDPAMDTLGIKFRRLGLRAATKQLMSQSEPNREVDHYMKSVIEAALTFRNNEEERFAWIDTIFDLIDTSHRYLHRYGNTIRTTAKFMPMEFLERVCSGDEKTREKRKQFVTLGRKDEMLFKAIDINVLIGWCKIKDNYGVWPLAASGVCAWRANKHDGSVEISDAAMKILEAAPNKKDVLMVYSCKIIPHIYSWDGGNVMRNRLLAIKKLAEHPNPEIALAALTVSKKAAKDTEELIEKRRSLKVRSEQKFE